MTGPIFQNNLSMTPFTNMSIFTISRNSFENQRPGEEVILITRKHWIRIAVPMFLASLFALAPIVFLALAGPIEWYQNYRQFSPFILTVYYLFLWNIAFYRIMIYTLNTVIVTNVRIIENEQRGLFRHNTDEIALKNIEDSSVRIFGILATLLDYGGIEIQSAGATNIFHFKYLPHPEKIKKMIAAQVNYMRSANSNYLPPPPP